MLEKSLQPREGGRKRTCTNRLIYPPDRTGGGGRLPERGYDKEKIRKTNRKRNADLEGRWVEVIRIYIEKDKGKDRKKQEHWQISNSGFISSGYYEMANTGQSYSFHLHDRHYKLIIALLSFEYRFEDKERLQNLSQHNTLGIHCGLIWLAFLLY